MKENIVDILDAWINSQMERIHTMVPGKIESYNSSTKRAKVKILIKLKTSDGEDLSIPPIENVPVVFPTVKSFSLKFPLEKGDGCAIFFAETGIGNFLNGQGNEVSADDISRFSLTDAVAFVGLYGKNDPAGDSTIEITSAGDLNIDSKKNVNVNGDNKSFVTHAELDSALQTFMNALNLHIHTTTATVGPTAVPGIISPPTVPMTLNIAAAETQTVKTGG